MLNNNPNNLNSTPETNSHLVFIDSGIDNYQTLIEDYNEDARIVILNDNYDGIEQISSVLAQNNNLETVEIFAHGDTASLDLGNSQLTLDTLNTNRKKIQGWSEAFSDRGEMLIYGCNVALGDMGRAFVSELSQLTATDIAASNDLTGNSQLGGDWDLEVTTGAIESTSALSAMARTNFNSVFVSFNGNEYELTSTYVTWEQAQAQAISLGGNLVTINDIIEQQWISENFGTDERFWIGFSDRDTEGEFEWVSGENSPYTDWLEGQPNDFGTGQDYTVINWDTNSEKWNDLGGQERFRGIIEIKKNPGEIALDRDSYSLNEEDGTISVQVKRTGGSDGAISVDYKTADGSATADTDYTPVSGTLTFAAGETSKTIEISAIDDINPEANESFSLILDNVTNDGTLGDPRSASIDIVDNDRNGVNFADFSDTSELTFNGDAGEAEASLRLTSTDNAAVGSAFFNDAINIGEDTSFQTQFQFQLGGSAGTDGASGFTFMLQNSNAGVEALGSSGYRLGYGNISDSVAIEFDNYDSGDYDPNNNHLSLLTNGDVPNPLATAEAPFDLNGGDALNAWVEYNGNNNRLSVFLSDNTNKPNSPILVENVDLTSLVGDRAFVGFSAANGFNNNTNTHDIQKWSFSSSVEAIEPPTVEDLLPDLQIISSSVTEGLRVDTEEQPGRALLRFTSEVANSGDGPLEIWADEVQGNTQPVFQRIYQDDGESRDVAAGGFSYFEPHGHSHFDDFAVFNLRTINSDGSVGDIVVTGDSKYSFCLVNIRQPFPDLTNNAIIAEGRGGDSCGDVQGISVGYSDVYNSNLANQWIDVTEVADGEYWLETIVDPKNRILETEDDNNVTRVRVTVDNPLV